MYVFKFWHGALSKDECCSKINQHKSYNGEIDNILVKMQIMEKQSTNERLVQ